MYEEAITRYIHFIAIFGVVSAMVAEHLLLTPQMSRKAIHRLAIIDTIYGISAIIMVGAGLYLWFGTGKPAEFYATNPIFHTKVGLAILMGVLSLWPTVFFLKNRDKASDEIIGVPAKLKWFIRIELLIVFSLPMLASLVARGIGS